MACPTFIITECTARRMSGRQQSHHHHHHSHGNYHHHYQPSSKVEASYGTNSTRAEVFLHGTTLQRTLTSSSSFEGLRKTYGVISVTCLSKSYGVSLKCIANNNEQNIECGIRSRDIHRPHPCH